MDTNVQEILTYFQALSAVPRQSKHEEKVRNWLESWAGEHGFRATPDSAGNLLVAVPGTAGLEQAAPIVLQAHMDMVCEKAVDSQHDFSRDPIVPVRDGEWLTAAGTTLGADNGIGVAMAMTAATAADLAHPPLELLFTVDEETGLTGASALQPGFFSGKVLINVDSEDEGVFTVGCAGGQNTLIEVPVERESDETGSGWATRGTAVEVTVSGLKGGHSGVDIHQVRANANVLLVRFLDELLRKYELRIAGFKGGSAHNAIPRDAGATIICSDDAVQQILVLVRDFESTVRNEYRGAEPHLSVAAVIREDRRTGAPLSRASSALMIRVLRILPHGVQKMSPDIPGLVQTSTNLASIELKEDSFQVLTSQRSSLMSEIDATAGIMEAVASMVDGKARVETRYPAWEPNLESQLLKRSTDLYRSLFDREPVVEIIHAGLECGVIASRYSGMDMISLGPTITGAHSPDERLNVPSVEQVWLFLSKLIASFAAS